jgi:hypothetical protein
MGDVNPADSLEMLTERNMQQVPQFFISNKYAVK